MSMKRLESTGNNNDPSIESQVFTIDDLDYHILEPVLPWPPLCVVDPTNDQPDTIRRPRDRSVYRDGAQTTEFRFFTNDYDQFEPYAALLSIDKQWHAVMIRIIRVHYKHHWLLSDRVLRFFTPTEMHLDSNTIISTDVLCSCTALHTLMLHGRGVEHNVHRMGRAVSHLTALTTLQCSYIELTDSDLCPLTRLTTLEFAHVSGITNCGLKRLKGLTSLGLGHGTSITDEALLCLSSLTSLDLSGDKNITPHCVSQLTTLTELRLFGNRCVCDTDLAPLTRLTGLELSYNTHVTQNGIAHLATQLRWLISQPLLESDFVARCTNLTYLDIDTNYANRVLHYGTSDTLHGMTRNEAEQIWRSPNLDPTFRPYNRACLHYAHL